MTPNISKAIHKSSRKGHKPAASANPTQSATHAAEILLQLLYSNPNSIQSQTLPQTQTQTQTQTPSTHTNTPVKSPVNQLTPPKRSTHPFDETFAWALHSPTLEVADSGICATNPIQSQSQSQSQSRNQSPTLHQSQNEAQNQSASNPAPAPTPTCMTEFPRVEPLYCDPAERLPFSVPVHLSVESPVTFAPERKSRTYVARKERVCSVCKKVGHNARTCEGV